MTSRQETNFGTIFQAWPLKPLPEVAFFQEGPGLRKWQWTDSGMKVINVTNILGDGSIDVTNTARFISTEEFENKYQHFSVEAGDIVIASSGNTYGKVGRVNHSHLPIMMNTSVIRFHPSDPAKLDQDFLYAFLRSNLFRNQMESFVIGSAQPNFGPSHLKRMVIPYPNISTQRKIAGILSAYDDLIENNTRRIAILEEMAQAIYREWFVHFRFPGHEQVRLVDSPLGKIPEGWKHSLLSDVADVNALSVKKGKEPDWVHYVDIASVSTGSIDEIRLLPFSEAPGRARRIVRHGDLIWSTVRPNRKSYSLIVNPLPNTIVSTGFAVISGTKAPFSYLYHALTTDDFVGHLVNHATGSAYPAVNASDFEKATILVPADNVLAAFQKITEPMFLARHCFAERNGKLRACRDLLLPKLISGQLDVEELDIDPGQPLDAVVP
jgi:type I restriction enzyme S subunit